MSEIIERKKVKITKWKQRSGIELKNPLSKIHNLCAAGMERGHKTFREFYKKLFSIFFVFSHSETKLKMAYVITFLSPQESGAFSALSYK